MLWSAGTAARYKAWRSLRDSLNELSSAEALQLTSTWWKSSPAVRRTFDLGKQDTWPNPWTLLYQEEQCPNSIILGIWYTLALAQVDTDNIQLSIISDREQKQNLLALIIDSEVVITYNNIMSAVDTESLEILNIFDSQELKKLVR
jgi:hypothetical protein